MDRELAKLAEYVEDTILQLSYPGFENRSFKLGLPDSVSKLPPRTYTLALKHESVLVKLAALRWFQERPGIAKSHLSGIDESLDDKDEWVRLESVHCMEKIENVDQKVLEHLCTMVKDDNVEVRKAVAKALGKIGGKSQTVVEALQQASEDGDHEVRWKAQKALRKLGAYAS